MKNFNWMKLKTIIVFHNSNLLNVNYININNEMNEIVLMIFFIIILTNENEKSNLEFFK